MAPTTHITRPPRCLRVVREAPPALWKARVDWSSWYLTDEEDMGESPLQTEIIWLFRSILAVLIEQRDWHVHLSADQFFGWMRSEPLVRVSPDVFVVEGGPPTPLPKSYQTWRPGHRAPLFALEVVSDEWRKDYDLNPQKYAELGVRELAIYDPHPSPRTPERVTLQVYQALEDGTFARVYAGPGPFRSSTLEAYLVPTGSGDRARLRLARDADGNDLHPSEAERSASRAHALESEREKRAEAERKRAEAERKRAEAERALRAERAERARLEAELNELRARRDRDGS